MLTKAYHASPTKPIVPTPMPEAARDKILHGDSTLVDPRRKVNKTLLLRKSSSHFIETAATDGKHPASRSYENWEKLAVRLSNVGLLPEEIATVKSEFDSGKDTTLVQIP